MGQIGIDGMMELMGNQAERVEAVEFRAFLMGNGYTVDLDGEPKITKNGEEIEAREWQVLMEHCFEGMHHYYEKGDCMESCIPLGFYHNKSEACAAYGLEPGLVVEAMSDFDAAL
jgi:hypothetical protein